MVGEIRLAHWAIALSIATAIQAALLSYMTTLPVPQERSLEGGLVVKLSANALPIATVVASVSLPSLTPKPDIVRAGQQVATLIAQQINPLGLVQVARLQTAAVVLPPPVPLVPAISEVITAVEPSIPLRPKVEVVDRASQKPKSKPKPKPISKPSPPEKTAEVQALAALLVEKITPVSAAANASPTVVPAAPVSPNTEAVTERVGSVATVAPPSESAARKANYEAQLLAWIVQHKRYPRRARRRGLEGVVEVMFRLDRKGRVVQSQVDRSSGHDLLDEAVIQLLDRASPMPLPPEQYSKRSLEFRIPIAFNLR